MKQVSELTIEQLNDILLETITQRNLRIDELEKMLAKVRSEVDAVYMATRVMIRNRDRAADALTVTDNRNLLRSIQLESAAWLTDYAPKSVLG